MCQAIPSAPSSPTTPGSSAHRRYSPEPPGARPAPRRGADPPYESIEEFRAGATAVRFAVGFWRLLLGDLDYRQLIPQTVLEPGSAAVVASDYLSTFFDWGLEPFHPGLSVDWDSPVTAGTFEIRPRVETLPQSKRSANLYHLCCLELYNHIVEGATYRTCANEPCGRTFVRQEGRAEHGQHRTKGVKYCSATCAAPKPNVNSDAESDATPSYPLRLARTGAHARARRNAAIAGDPTRTRRYWGDAELLDPESAVARNWKCIGMDIHRR